MSRARYHAAALLIAAALGAVITGCGTPGTPLPPSLNLPDRVTDLAATRTGDQVALTWTMPKRNTDKSLLKANISAHVCRKEGNGPCSAVGDVSFAPANAGSFRESLPRELSAGEARPVTYFVELKNRKGRSAGPSNAAVILAGEAPGPVMELAAEVRKQGIVLRWEPGDAGGAIRLKRTLLNAPAAKEQRGLLAAPAETVTQDLLVEHNGGMALDKGAAFGRSYEYRAQRVAQVTADGKTMELAGEWSAPIRVDVQDVFPPAVPTGLAAVATAAGDGVATSIDLSWQPDAETDVAGYYVYRREDLTPWKRISGEKTVVGPAFHDADVLAGHTYIYGVSAVDARGNESGRSEDAQETVPKQ
ncbi:MAG TPA: hypothetical protein VGJ21_02610 [Terracidiphilus sp.]|jgi:hypothetical protein